jgi:hypothetical protein
MHINRIIAMFRKRNVCVCGLRGDGKDMLMGNVIARRKEPYISQFSYTKNDKGWQEFDFDKIDCGKNGYLNFIRHKIKYYKFPYVKGSDVYISDAGVYLPSQYCNELNKHFPYLASYSALSRHLGRSNIHINVQNLNRLYDKLREQSDIYIRCRFCWIPFGKLILNLKEKRSWKLLDKIPLLVIQKITLYDKYQSALDRVEPCRISVPFLAKREVKQNAQIYLDKFRNTYGSVRNHILVYWNKSTYDTHYFEKLLLQGEKQDNES